MKRYHRIDIEDRYTIEKMLNHKYSIAEIANTIEVTRQALYVEISHGLTNVLTSLLETRTVYSAKVAQSYHDFISTSKGAPVKLGKNYQYAVDVAEKIIKHGYSPDTIAGELKVKKQWTVCARTLYTYIDKGYIPGISNKDLPEKLKRKKRKDKEKDCKKKLPRYGKSIEFRPDEIFKRYNFGHWEMDLIVSSLSKPCLLTMIERKTRFLIIRKIKNRKTETVARALKRIYKEYGVHNFQSITVDNGSEFSGHKAFSHYKGHTVDIYFCHPFCASERGSNERANRQVRRYYPKKTDFQKITVSSILNVQNKINQVPRRILHYSKPADLFNTAE